MDEKFLLQILETPSVSGNELQIQKMISKYMETYSDKQIKHHSNNLIQVLNENSKMKILLSGHIDEIGLCITKILENGLCHVTKVGGIYPNLYAGQKVCVVKKDNSTIYGVVVFHSDKINGAINADDLLVDIGFDTKEKTEQLISIGDYVILDTTYRHLQNNRITARALDDRLGAFICLEVLKRAKELNAKNGIYVSTSVGEETTKRGATFASSIVQPTCSIIIDVTYATDQVTSPNGFVSLGKGPVICRSTIVNERFNAFTIERAKKLNINLQYEVFVGRTGTDADAIHFFGSGIPCILISIPLRNMHSPVEMCDLSDVEDIIELAAQVVTNISEEFDFNGFNE